MTIKFAHPARSMWSLDPTVTYINHGTVGVTPNAVRVHRRALQDEMEANPARFLFRKVSGRIDGNNLMRDAAHAVGDFLGAKGCDLAFVDNTTAGIYTVVSCLELGPSDRVLTQRIGYGAVHLGLEFMAKRQGFSVDYVDTPLPITDPAEVCTALQAAITTDTRLVIVDQINSFSGIVFDVQAVAKMCREQGVLCLVDGAHSPGSLALKIEDIGADFFVGNLHKWCWTPRSSAIVWCHPDHQHLLNPSPISWPSGLGFPLEFDYVGTRDFTNHLSAPFAIQELKRVGFERLLTYNQTLVRQATDTVVLECGAVRTAPADCYSTMSSVLLPTKFGTNGEQADALQNALFESHRIETHLKAHDGRILLRLAAQIYNAPEDYQTLVQALNAQL